MTDEDAAGRSLAAVCDVTDLRHVIVTAHHDVAVFTGTARFANGYRNYNYLKVVKSTNYSTEADADIYFRRIWRARSCRNRAEKSVSHSNKTQIYHVSCYLSPQNGHRRMHYFGFWRHSPSPCGYATACDR